MKQIIRSGIKAKNLLMERVFVNQLDFPDKLTFSHFRVLVQLSENGAAALHEVGRYTKITKTNLSPVISYLEKMGYVTVVKDKKDKRIRIAHITALGKKFCNRKKAELEQHIAERLTLLNPEGLKLFEEGCQKIIEALDSKKM